MWCGQDTFTKYELPSAVLLYHYASEPFRQVFANAKKIILKIIFNVIVAHKIICFAYFLHCCGIFERSNWRKEQMKVENEQTTGRQ